MKTAKLLPLLLAVLTLGLLASLVVTNALAPAPQQSIHPTSETVVSNLLSGTVAGLDRRDGVRMNLEQLAAGQAEGRGEIVQRFDVVNGRWHRPGLVLPTGYYRLTPEADGYIHVPRSITFQVPEKGIFWRYQALDFRFYHPADAVALLGLPLCPDTSSPIVPVTTVPEETPSPAPGPVLVPAGPCYANHLADALLVPAGLQGRIGGLPDGQTATISLYALPPLPGEQYGQGEPPSTDGSGTYPPEVARLDEYPEIAPEWPLTATLRVGNGPWGLLDPSLVGHKYLVVTRADGQAVDPPAYEVVVFAGKAPGFPGGIDFAFTPGKAELAPVARSAPADSATEVAELVESNTAFALDLYQALRTEGDDNLIYSPYSISLALGMTYAGARGETESQMADTLHFKLPQERLHPAFNTLAQELDRRSTGTGGTDKQSFRLNIANALWGQEGYRFQPEFLDLLAANYGAEIRSVDFREKGASAAINDWVSQKTEGRIEELVPPEALDASTGLALTNAVYFKAAWASPFERRRTQRGVFHLLDGSMITTPMMNQWAAFAYTEGSDYQAVQLPYEGHEMAMVILLPAQGQFEAFERSLDAKRLEAVLESLTERQVALTLPRFEVRSGYDLEAVLEAMGMPLAFTLQADFSGMAPSQELCIGDVFHEATISVGEAGTEATAATAVEVLITGEPWEATTITVDRPFLFLIRDLQTGSILFVGRVVDPGGSLES
ncbi:MAG: serpin family protein [Anaerolineae bacterium]|jgi:serpin B